MAWAYLDAANVCIQILLVIALGYVMTWRGVVTHKFLPQINTFLLDVSFPSLKLWNLGITLNLRDGADWLAIGAYTLWVVVIQVFILVYVWVFRGRDVGEAAQLNLLLVANNTIVMGLPIMRATFGATGRYIALLTGLPLYLLVMPFSLILFEMEEWALKQREIKVGKGTAVAKDMPGEDGSAGAASQRRAHAELGPSAGMDGHDSLEAPEPALASEPSAPTGGRTAEVCPRPSRSVSQSRDVVVTVIGIPEQIRQQRPGVSTLVRRHSHADGRSGTTQQGAGAAPPAVAGGNRRRVRPGRSHRVLQEQLRRLLWFIRWRKNERQRDRVMSSGVVDVPVPLAPDEQLNKFSPLTAGAAGGPRRVTEHHRAMQQQRGPAAKREAMQDALMRHGNMLTVFWRFIYSTTRSRPARIALHVFNNPTSWSLFLAIVISVSGLRERLDPNSAQFVDALEWLVDPLALLSQTTVPLALFGNGVFLYGKKIWEGHLMKVFSILLLKVFVLPFLQLACCKLVGLGTERSMSLMVLSVAPTASTAFVVAAKYRRGEVMTLVTLVMTVLLIPLVLAALYVPQAINAYEYDPRDLVNNEGQ